VSIDAVFERGVFRPTAPVDLQEGARVTLSFDADQPLAPPQSIVATLAEIAAMPSQSPDDGFSGADHDDLLYGTKGAR
jgi:predicted DNA-binding antitoxin AbrB/MazE fold protein